MTFPCNGLPRYIVRKDLSSIRCTYRWLLDLFSTFCLAKVYSPRASIYTDRLNKIRRSFHAIYQSIHQHASYSTPDATYKPLHPQVMRGTQSLDAFLRTRRPGEDRGTIVTGSNPSLSFSRLRRIGACYRAGQTLERRPVL